MSTSIRPGGPVAGSTGVESLEGPSAAGESSAAGAVDASLAASSAASVQAPQVESSAALLGRLDAGELTREQAIEGLVAQALETHGGARLPAAQRAELESVLRAALADDPALASLLNQNSIG